MTTATKERIRNKSGFHSEFRTTRRRKLEQKSVIVSFIQFEWSRLDSERSYEIWFATSAQWDEMRQFHRPNENRNAELSVIMCSKLNDRFRQIFIFTFQFHCSLGRFIAASCWPLPLFSLAIGDAECFNRIRSLSTSTSTNSHNQILTCNFSHPLKIPSSSALILLPDKSKRRSWFNGRNSAVEKIGFNESPNRLSDNFRMLNVVCNENIKSIEFESLMRSQSQSLYLYSGEHFIGQSAYGIVREIQVSNRQLWRGECLCVIRKWKQIKIYIFITELTVQPPAWKTQFMG